MTAKPATIKLTHAQALLVWGILDGVADAGSCEGGLTKEDHDAVSAVVDQLNDYILKTRKRSS